jgi:hypothetical protein
MSIWRGAQAEASPRPMTADMCGRFVPNFEVVALAKFLGLDASKVCRDPLLPPMPLEEFPHEVVGRNVQSGSAEDLCGRFPSRPGMTPAVDHYQHHFAPSRPRRKSAVSIPCLHCLQATRRFSGLRQIRSPTSRSSATCCAAAPWHLARWPPCHGAVAKPSRIAIVV